MSIRDENGVWKQEASELSNKIQKTLENILDEVLDAGLTVEDFYYLVGTEADLAIAKYSILKRKKERENEKENINCN